MLLGFGPLSCCCTSKLDRFLLAPGFGIIGEILRKNGIISLFILQNKIFIYMLPIAGLTAEPNFCGHSWGAWGCYRTTFFSNFFLWASLGLSAISFKKEKFGLKNLIYRF